MVSQGAQGGGSIAFVVPLADLRDKTVAEFEVRFVILSQTLDV